jgi:hypothetical protein
MANLLAKVRALPDALQNAIVLGALVSMVLVVVLILKALF